MIKEEEHVLILTILKRKIKKLISLKIAIMNNKKSIKDLSQHQEKIK